ncbi:MAG: hypothetical protein IRZ16_04000 [Myxococcaceae bacterium]|nr:hypothetical protein [Myxococcaceae bacterium]
MTFGAGCKSPCRQLSEKRCECTTGTVEREACLQDAQQLEENADARGDLDAAAQERCASFLETCDCHNIDTAEGKAACGLAR